MATSSRRVCGQTTRSSILSRVGSEWACAPRSAALAPPDFGSQRWRSGEDAEVEGARARDEQVGALRCRARARAALRVAGEPRLCGGFRVAAGVDPPARRRAPPTMVETWRSRCRLTARRARARAGRRGLHGARGEAARRGDRGRARRAPARLLAAISALEDGRSLRAAASLDGARLRVLCRRSFEPPAAFDALEPPPVVDAPRARARLRRSCCSRTRRRASPAALRATPGAALAGAGPASPARAGERRRPGGRRGRGREGGGRAAPARGIGRAAEAAAGAPMRASPSRRRPSRGSSTRAARADERVGAVKRALERRGRARGLPARSSTRRRASSPTARAGTPTLGSRPTRC